MRTLLFTTNDNYTLKDYIDYLIENDEFDETKEYSENGEFYKWCGDMREMDVDDFWANLRYPQHKGACILSGTLGLWNGRPDIRPMVFGDIRSAILRCISNSIVDFEVYYDDGSYEVYAHHHDGTNCFTISMLTESGERIARNRVEQNVPFEVVRNWIKRIPAKNYWLY